MFEETKAAVPVTLNPGPQYRVGSVSFEGADAFPPDDLRAEAGVNQGALYRAGKWRPRAPGCRRDTGARVSPGPRSRRARRCARRTPSADVVFSGT